MHDLYLPACESHNPFLQNNIPASRNLNNDVVQLLGLHLCSQLIFIINSSYSI